MPEGPTIVILREQVAGLVGKVVRAAEGNTQVIDPARMRGRKVLGFASWGKHFLVRFSGFALRVHFMLFGSYRLDDPKPVAPRLRLVFAGHELDFYACSVRYLEGDLDVIYDWRTDVMSEAWDPALARRRLKAMPETLVCDALLDQGVFAGVGNIIKNEVLFRIRVHPLSRIGALPPRKLGELIRQARDYNFDFLEWKKAYVLRQHWQVHRKGTCPECGGKLTIAHLGRTHRRAFWCEHCQVRYGVVDEVPVATKPRPRAAAAKSRDTSRERKKPPAGARRTR
jgi:endonuclease-8